MTPSIPLRSPKTALRSPFDPGVDRPSLGFAPPSIPLHSIPPHPPSRSKARLWALGGPPASARKKDSKGETVTNIDDKPITRQAVAAKNRSAPGKVTGRLHAAIMEMVWKGSCRADAAKAAQMTDHSLREALRRPHVKTFYLAELGILRTSERAKTFHRLCALRDQDENRNAAVAAAKLLEAIEADAPAYAPGSTRPGVTIIIGQAGSPPPMRTIEHEPAADDDMPPRQGGNSGRS
jgi:hypothetical protein